MDNDLFFGYVRFLKGQRDPEHEEADSACLSREMFKSDDCQRTVLPLFYFLTRSPEQKLSIHKMKRRFKCGAELIMRTRKAIDEKKPVPSPGHKRDKPVRSNEILRGLVDSMTTGNGGVSCASLAKVLGASPASINRIRHDLDYTYKPLRHGPVLNQRQVRARLLFCQRHANDDWSKTMFTDESRFATSPDCPPKWWVKKGDRIYMEKEKFPESFMAWGGIIGWRKTPLIKCPTRMNAQGYIELLENNHIVQFLRDCGDGAVLQQDGARCHTAVSTRHWLASQCVALLDGWPANSPDFSPIEQIWGIVKCFLVQRFGMTKPLTLRQLEEAAFKAYDDIEAETVIILTMSVKYRVQLCLSRNGSFVGDALDECCHRANVEYESLTAVEFPLSTVPEMEEDTRENGEENRAGTETTNELQPLPSFRDIQ